MVLVIMVLGAVNLIFGVICLVQAARSKVEVAELEKKAM